MKSSLHTLTIVIFFVGIAVFSARSVYAVDKTEIESKIQQRNEELKRINQQIVENQKGLTQTQNEKRTITSDLKKIDSNIKQIDLGIKSSEVTIDKLGYQLDVLSDDLTKTKEDIEKKEIAIGEIVRAIQNQDVDSVLFVLLQSKTLSDGVGKAQALSDLNKTLLDKISELTETKKHMEIIRDDTSKTKKEKEQEYQALKDKKVIVAELKNEKNSLLQQKKQKESEYQKSLSQLEEKQLAIASEIEKMEAQLRTQINYKELPKSLPGLLLVPTRGTITQDYGATKFAQKAYKGKWHNGLDFGAPVGTPIYAAADGVVVAVENQDLYCRKGAYGKYVAVKHDIGLVTLSAHMSLYSVKEGQRVSRGDIIGYVGTTGYATGAHLHFTVYDATTFRVGSSNSCGPKMPAGGDLNPRSYLSL